MPLPLDGQITIQSSTFNSSGGDKRQALPIRMTPDILAALHTFPNQPPMEVDLSSSKPGIYIGDTFFPIRITLAKDEGVAPNHHEIYQRTTNAQGKAAPLKLYAGVTGRIAIQRDLESAGKKLRAARAQAESERARDVIQIIEPPPATGAKGKKRAAAMTASSALTKRALKQTEKRAETLRAATAAVTASRASPAPPPRMSPAPVAPVLVDEQLKAKLVHLLALQESTPDELASRTKSSPASVNAILPLIAEPTKKSSSARGSSTATWSLLLEGWKTVRPFEHPGLQAADGIKIARAARSIFHRSSIPLDDPAWAHVRARTDDTNVPANAASTPAAKPSALMQKTKAKAKASAANISRPSTPTIAEYPASTSKARSTPAAAIEIPTPKSRNTPAASNEIPLPKPRGTTASVDSRAANKRVVQSSPLARGGAAAPSAIGSSSKDKDETKPPLTKSESNISVAKRKRQATENEDDGDESDWIDNSAAVKKRRTTNGTSATASTSASTARTREKEKQKERELEKQEREEEEERERLRTKRQREKERERDRREDEEREREKEKERERRRKREREERERERERERTADKKRQRQRSLSPASPPQRNKSTSARKSTSALSRSQRAEQIYTDSEDEEDVKPPAPKPPKTKKKVDQPLPTDAAGLRRAYSERYRDYLIVQGQFAQEQGRIQRAIDLLDKGQDGYDSDGDDPMDGVEFEKMHAEHLRLTKEMDNIRVMYAQATA